MVFVSLLILKVELDSAWRWFYFSYQTHTRSNEL